MIVYTGQIARLEPPYLDITVKSGQGVGRLLAPTWDMVLRLKRGVLSQDAYQQSYLQLLRERFRQDRAGFLAILTPANADALHIGCYCAPHTFCHRYLAVEVLDKIAQAHNIPFTYAGEWITCRCGRSFPPDPRRIEEARLGSDPDDLAQWAVYERWIECPHCRRHRFQVGDREERLLPPDQD